MDSSIGSSSPMDCDNTDTTDEAGGSSEAIMEIDLSEKKYLTDHKIDGKIIFPSMGYLILVWEAFAKLRNEDPEKLSIVIEDIRFNGSTEVPKDRPIKFVVYIGKNTGDFSIRFGGSITATGKICTSDKIEPDELLLLPPEPSNDSEYLELTTNDVYKILKIRGYDYNGIFKAIKNSDNRSSIGKLDWHENWISFIDAMFQFKMLSIDTRDLLFPKSVEYAVINPAIHKKLVESFRRKEEGIPVYSYPDINIVKSGGIELRGIETSSIARRDHFHQISPIHERYDFVPYENSPMLFDYPGDVNSSSVHSVSLTAFLQIVVENIGSSEIKAVEVADKRSAYSLLAPLIIDTLQSEPNVSVDIKIVSTVPNNYVALAEQWDLKTIALDVRKVPVGENLHLIIAANILTKSDAIILENLEASLKPGGFIILEETPIKNDIPQSCFSILHGLRLVLVGKRYTPSKIYILLKYKEKTVNETIIFMSENNFSWLEEIRKALKKSAANGGNILLVSQGEISGLIGLVNCIRREASEVKVSYVYIEDKYSRKFSPAAYSEQLAKQLTANVLKDGKWGSYRHLRIDRDMDVQPVEIKPFQFVTDMKINELITYAWTRIFVNNYRFYEMEHPEAIIMRKARREALRNLPSLRAWLNARREEEELQIISMPLRSRIEEFLNWDIHYCSLNLRYLLDNDKVPPTNVQPIAQIPKMTECYAVYDEFSGRDNTGYRIMGILITKINAPSGWRRKVKDHIRTKRHGYTWGVPEKWSLEEAATVPFAYAMAYHSLVVPGFLQTGGSVLVHAGAESIGQASIIIALHAGCKVFTTANSVLKIDFLKEKIPQLEHENILLRTSGDETFQDFIIAKTSGTGVDIVLNSLTKDKLSKKPRCLGKYGRFVEIKNFYLPEFVEFGGSMAAKNELNSTMEKVLQLVNEGIESGVVRPLQSCVFIEKDIEEAYKFMDSEEDIGKALLRLRENGVKKSMIEIVDGVPRIRMNPEKSYVLFEGLEDFGLELANWIISRGAKFVVLTSSSKFRTGYQTMRIRLWREKGINVSISTVDPSLELKVEQLLNDAEKIAPVGGIFNLASIRRDQSIDDQREKDFKIVAIPKIQGTKYLDVASRKLCRVLDHFVVFSSTASGRGRGGQTNYGFVNSAMEKIVERRKAEGFSGMAIQWDPDLRQASELTSGTISQSTSSCLETLDFFLQQPHTILASTVLAENHSVLS